MKKLYIQPTIYAKPAISLNILAGSPKLEEENYNNKKQDDGISGTVTPGTGQGSTGFGAKSSSFSLWSDDDI